MQKKLKYIDLFAGCGGLSLGLEQAGFELELAVEKSDMASETFYHNFIESIEDLEQWKKFAATDTSVLEQAKKKLVVKELQAVLDCPELIEQLQEKRIDLIAGGPPCQGFSLAGRRNPNDVRNKLAWQFLELVEQIQPKAVVIENVSGMAQDFKKHNEASPFGQLRIALSQTGIGYEVQPLLLNAMHYGAPQHRPRVLLVGIRKDISKEVGLKAHDVIWRSEYDQVGSVAFAKRPRLAPITKCFDEDILTVADAIGDLNKNGYRRLTNLSAFAKEMRENNDWISDDVKKGRKKRGLSNHRLRKHSEHIETRFRIYQYLRDQGIHSKILAIPKRDDLLEEGKKILIKQELANSRYPAKSPDKTIIAKTKDELVELIMTLGTKKHSQRPLNWSQPSPTVVSLPDDYVHPDEARTLTVREMARFQSFPDSFIFRAKETTGSLRRRFEVPQYTQVGNAVPPKLALAIGKTVHSVLIEALVKTTAQSKNQKKAG